ncbi:gamma-glutamyltransferase family protein [Thermodesulfobacteriota bacterium]
MDFPYASQRMPVFARNVVATSQPLAAQAGLNMLRKGGNAMDAALTAAITLAVVEPTHNGIGSDAFAIVWDGKRLSGLNGSGRSPKALSPERFAGQKTIPALGWDAVTVPGAVDAWSKLSERFGSVPFPELFEPAIRYAENGFLVSPKIAGAWTFAQQLYKEFPDFADAFLPGGQAPVAGQLFRCPQQARTLEEIAATKGESFYRGKLAERIAAHAESTGGLLTADDLSAHESEWVDPLSQEYHGIHLHEIPPNGQGLAALIALGILRHLDIRNYPMDSAESIHLQVEAMKIAFAEAHRHIADPASMVVDPQALLDDAFLAERAKEIRMDRAMSPPSVPVPGGTVYLTAADDQGMMVSFIQSPYMSFGSGIVVPGTGICLQSRGSGFTLEEGHPNQVAGGKRPYHTIIPGFVTRNNQPVMSFGVMGAHMQPQGHVQMIIRIFDYGLNPQAASDAPRWHVYEDYRLALETGFDTGVIEGLKKRGHTLEVGAPPFLFGGAQLIMKTESGFCAASDHRKDGQAIGF